MSALPETFSMNDEGEEMTLWKFFTRYILHNKNSLYMVKFVKLTNTEGG